VLWRNTERSKETRRGVREETCGLQPKFHPVPQRTLHKDRKGGDLFLFTHLTVEVSVFIYLFIYPVHRDVYATHEA